MKIRLFGFLTVLSLLVGLLGMPYGRPAAADDGPPAAQDVAADKLEEALVSELSAGGTADFVVRFKEQADLSAAYNMGWDQRGEFVYNTLRALAETSQARAKGLLDGTGLSYQTFIAGNELYVWGGSLQSASSVAALPEVASIRATRTYQVDPIIEQHVQAAAGELAWGILYTGADQFWGLFGLQGDGIKVANIDTGVQYDHPALDQSFACPGDPGNAACWADPSAVCPGGTACDNNGHGTHTMGTMVADDDPSLTWRAGMAPNATWIACKGCETNSCSDFALNACADWILAPAGSPANRPHVVNNSWGGGSCDTWYQGKVQAWRAAGVFPAFSAGNEGAYGCETVGTPGDYQESFASAAVDSGGTVAGFSSRGPSCFGHDPYTKPNISAPGVNICSTVPGGGWSCAYSGTSMASPHSAGAVALLWSCNPSLIGQMGPTFEALQNTAGATPDGSCGAPPDGEGNYTYGYGYLDIMAAGQAYCADVGVLNGTVTDGDSGEPLPDITITAERAGGGVAAMTTDPLGQYEMGLPSGTYTVTAAGPPYMPQAVSNVTIVADTVTTQNFSLLTAIVFDPSPIHVTLDWQTTDSLEATVSNRLPGPYDFELTEGGRGSTNVLLLCSDDNPCQPIQAQLQAYGDLSAVDAMDVSSATPTPAELEPYDVVVTWSNYMYGDPTAMGNVLADYVDGGGKVINLMFSMGTSGWQMAGRFMSEGYTAMNGTSTIYGEACLGAYDPGHPIMAGVTAVCDSYRLAGTYLTAGSHEVAQWADGQLFVAAKDDGSAVSIAGYVGTYAVWTGQMDDVVHNAVLWLVSRADVPWLAEDPITGTVPAGSDLAVTLDFMATYAAGVDQPGDYETVLFVNGDPTVAVPVVMTVLPAVDLGRVYGTVLDSCTGDPVGAHIAIDPADPIGETMADPETGGYEAWLVEGSYDLTFTADGYVPFTATVDIVADEMTMLDVDLAPDRPCMAVAPEMLEVWLPTGTTDYLHPAGIDITNPGGAALEFEVVELPGGYTPPVIVSIPAFTGEIEPDAVPPTTDRAPSIGGGDAPAADGPAAVLAGEPAYAMEISPNTNLVYIPDTTAPGTWNVVAPVTGNFYAGGDFLNGDFSTLYAVNYSTNQFVAVDTATGAETVIGTPSPTGSWTGMTASTDGTLYVSSSSCGTSSTLYTIDPATGALTTVGTVTNATCLIDIAINAEGEMYGVDLVTDALVQINPATGAGTVVGSLGVNANYAQGMDFEEVTGVLYWAAYVAQGELRVIDTSTGASTLVGAFPSGAETDSLAFATYPGGFDVPWLSEDPVTGIVGSGEAANVGVTFTTVVTDPLPLGTYDAKLRVRGNDPLVPSRDVVVVMHVVEAFAPPVASFNSNSPVLVGEPVIFTNTTTPGVPPETTYLWSFGDGTTSTLENPTHVYEMYGPYTVTLEACNSELCDEFADTVEIEPRGLFLPLLVRGS
jgi:hypothetical protein